MYTDKTSCNEVSEKLPLYVGGDLDSDVLEAVRSHLGGCPDCARRVEQATHARSELIAAFRALGPAVERTGLWSSIRSTLRAEGRIRATSTPAPAFAVQARRWRWAWALVPAAAAAAILFVIELGGEDPRHAAGLRRDSGIVATPVSAPAPAFGSEEPGLRNVDPQHIRPLAPAFQRGEQILTVGAPGSDISSARFK